MAQFVIKNLPKGFIYLVPPHHIRPLIKRYDDFFTNIEYEGISMSEQNVSKWETKRCSRRFHLGILESFDNDGLWEFYLVLNGVREANLPEDSKEIASDFLADIESRVKNILALPPTASKNVGRLFMHYEFNTKTGEAKYSSFIPK